MFHQYLYHQHPSPSALLFPAVNPRRRYLIHSTVQDHFPELTTVSVGEGDQRRTAVTFRKSPGVSSTSSPAPESSPSVQIPQHSTANSTQQRSFIFRNKEYQQHSQPDASQARRTPQHSSVVNPPSASQQHLQEKQNSYPESPENHQAKHKHQREDSSPNSRVKQDDSTRKDTATTSSKLEHEQHPRHRDGEQYYYQHNNNRCSQTAPSSQHNQEQQQQHPGAKQNKYLSKNTLKTPVKEEKSSPVSKQEVQNFSCEAQQPVRQQQQRTRQHRLRKNRSRSSHSEPRRKSRENSVDKGNEGGGGGGRTEDGVKESGWEETQSKRRRNRRNRRLREKLEQSNNGDVNGENEGNGKVETKHDRKSDGGLLLAHSDRKFDDDDEGDDNDEVSGVRQDGPSKCNESVIIKNYNNNINNYNNKNSNSNTSEGGRRKKLKSYGENVDDFRNNRKNSRSQDYNTRLPSSTKIEAICGPSQSETSTSIREDRMPVTMPPENYNTGNHGDNRRRGKASAQIYRPPPARGKQSETLPQQQQQFHNYQQKSFHQNQQDPHHNNHYQQQSQQYYHNHQPFQQLSNRQRTDSESSAVTGGDYQGKASKGRRPDQVLYVPRGRRSAPADCGSARGTPTPFHDYDPVPRPPSPAYSVSSVASEYSGRNRYNKQGSRQGSQISLFEEDSDRVKGKPPVSKGGDFSRESTPGYSRPKNGGRFSTHTLQLIERCLNHDTEQKHNDAPGWEADSSPKNNRNNGRVQKSPTPTRDIHSIHSKENVIHPVESSPRSRKSRRNRRRHSRSREPSAEQHKNMPVKDDTIKGSPSYGDYHNNSYGERGFGSCERVFYNSSYGTGHDRYDRGYDNYDRYSSINSSRASSRNSSRERTMPHQSPHHNWRVGSNPSSPAKNSSAYYQDQNSSGKPPSGRLGSLPNVSLDFGESSRRIPNDINEENQRCQTLPVRHHKAVPGRTSAYSIDNNRIQEYESGCITSDRLDSSTSTRESPSVSDRLDPYSSSGLNPDISEPVGCNLHARDKFRHNIDNSHGCSSSQNDVDIQQTNQHHSVTEETKPSKDPAIDLGSNVEEKALNSSLNQSVELDQSFQSSGFEGDNCVQNTDMKISSEDSVSESVDVKTTRASSEEEIFYDTQAEEAVIELTKDVVLTDSNGIENLPDRKANNNELEDREEKKNVKKFSFNWADEVEDSWDNLYDDSGECLDPEIKRQLSESIGKVKLEKPANDYYEYEAKDPDINEDEFAHVIEIYDFPVSFKTQDLMSVFNCFHSTGFDIKWVDDTHALGVFATALIASEALNLDHPFLKTRSLALATKSSRAKAMRITEALLPYKPRPQTSAALARRLVSGALGLKVNISREVREAEKQKLKDAKAQKRLMAKQRMDAWEGTLT